MKTREECPRHGPELAYLNEDEDLQFLCGKVVYATPPLPIPETTRNLIPRERLRGKKQSGLSLIR